jgi:hypothetical protein
MVSADLAAAAQHGDGGVGDPTVAAPTRALVAGAEMAWRGRVWQKGNGQRSRAMALAKSASHTVLLSMQVTPPPWMKLAGELARYYASEEWKRRSQKAKGFLTTSFKDYDAMEAFVGDTPPWLSAYYELIAGACRVYVDIDRKRAEGESWTPEEDHAFLVAHVDGLIDFMRADFGVAVTYASWLVLDACTSAKAKLTRPLRSARRMRPSQSAMMPTSGRAIFITAVSAI